MTLIIYPPLVPPRCTRCLLSVDERSYIPSDVCSDACLMKIDTRQIGERANWGHLHWECRCGFVWATMTALQSGRDAERQ
jgi:hypothetical protein